MTTVAINQVEGGAGEGPAFQKDGDIITITAPLIRRASPLIIPFSSKEEWLEKRYEVIGASDAAPALGLSKYMSPLQLFRQKKRIDPPTEENPSMKWGHRHEVSVCSEFAELHPEFEVVETSWIYAHPDYPFIAATIDRDIRGLDSEGLKHILEAKSTRSHNAIKWGESGSDGVNLDYIPQCLQQLGVCNADINHVAVIIGTDDYREYELRRAENEERIARVFQRVAAFWNNHIVANIEPEARTAADIIMLFPESRAGSIEATPEIKDDVEILIAKKAEIKALEEETDELKARLQFYMSDFDTLVSDGSILATWKSGKPGMTFDEKVFAAKHPVLYKEFQVDKTVSRTFLTKKPKVSK